MKVLLVIICCTSAWLSAFNQVSVYSCESLVTPIVTPADLEPSGSTFHQSCIEIDQGDLYGFSDSYQKDIRATEYIRISQNNPFWAGHFDEGAGMTLAIEKPTFDVAVMNYPNLTNIEKFKKLEFGVELSAEMLLKIDNFFNNTGSELDQLNPFLDWKLDVEAEFTAPDGSKKIVDAFYYIEYNRNSATNSWDVIPTDYPMRIRFSPPTIGNWNCVVAIKDANGLVATSTPFLFKVIETGAHGYVSVHPNQRNLQLDGQMIFPVGVNFPSPYRGVEKYHTGPNYTANFQPNETHKVTTLQNWLDYHDDIESYNEQGGKFIRTLQSAWATLIEFEDKGDYHKRLNYAWEQDRLLDYCEANNMFMHFNMLEQEPYMRFGNYSLFNWDWAHWRSDGSWEATDLYPDYCYADDNGLVKSPHEMFSNDNDLEYHEQRTRYYISRYGYSTSIYLFELLNEPEHVGQLDEPIYGNGSPDAVIIEEAVVKYQTRISHYIKSNLGHTEHLIGVNISNQFDGSIYSPDVDVIGWNRYSSDARKLVITKNESEVGQIATYNGENTYFKSFNDIFQHVRKPILIPEGGPGDGIDACSEFTQQNVDMMTFGFTGIAGFNSWAGFDEGQRHTWPLVIRVQNHMNGQDVIGTLSNISGFWNQGREVSEEGGNGTGPNDGTKEHQYYLSEDQEKAVGYIKNLTFNAFTKNQESPSTCGNLILDENINELRNLTANQGQIKISGLKPNTDYIAHWYDYQTGNYMSSECFETGLLNGTAKLNHPVLDVYSEQLGDFDPFSPVIWYVIYQFDCNQGLTQLIGEMSEPSENVLDQNDAYTTSDIEPVMSVTVKPNPFDSEVVLTSEKIIGEYFIYDALMQEVQHGFIGEHNIKLSTSNLSSGVYFIILPQDNYQIKMIKL